MTEIWQHCEYAPERGQTPPLECMSIFTTEESWERHLSEWHPSRRQWLDRGDPHPFEEGSLPNPSEYARCVAYITASGICGLKRDAAVHS